MEEETDPCLEDEGFDNDVLYYPFNLCLLKHYSD